MPQDPRKRQKALMKKRSKQKAASEHRSHQQASMSISMQSIIRRAREWVRCIFLRRLLAEEGWWG